MAISEAQTKAINQAIQAAETCAARAPDCGRLGLAVLAREYEYFARSLRENIERQKKALEGGVDDLSKATDPA